MRLRLIAVAVSEGESAAVSKGWFDHDKRTSARLSSIGSDSEAPTYLVKLTNATIAALEASANGQ